MLCAVTLDCLTTKGILSFHFFFKTISITFCNFRACEALCQCLPDQLKDDTFSECLKDDKSTKHWLTMLLKNLENMTPGQQGSGGGGGGGGGQSMNTVGVNKNLAGGPKLPGGL